MSVPERSRCRTATAPGLRGPAAVLRSATVSTTEPFCESCDRSRLTADGVWLMCLYASAGTDLRRPLRAGASAEELRHLISTVWASRSDRGAEERLAFATREPLIPVSALKKNAHLEMHTRGG